MVNMAETESMFLVAGSRLGVNGGTTDTGSEDSDLEPGPVASFQETKRNKRKNFQPRNISYCEEREHDDHIAMTMTAQIASTHIDDSICPMDLSCSRSDRTMINRDYNNRSGGNSNTIANSKYLLQQAFLHHHHHHTQPTDASDIREYAQNTVKELLEIYGLNSAEVAESITNNVPIANFSSGKQNFKYSI
ncbi:hypothetical protein O3M35_008020 [Rhynocoris fuscipes]|uniref:Uncharacterized protein n=1 Tax=Rhynocoris fuscipes TaxID=488301 RepID=A0AAW1D629_9HEMI